MIEVNGDIKNFYDLDFKKINVVNEEGVSVLFLLRIFWSVMRDLDNEKNEYDVKEWNIENYVNFFNDNLDKIDLNKDNYRMYYKDLVEFYISKVNVELNK